MSVPLGIDRGAAPHLMQRRATATTNLRQGVAVDTAVINLAPVHHSERHPQLVFSSDSNLVAFQISEQFGVFDAESGRMIWTERLASAIGRIGLTYQPNSCLELAWAPDSDSIELAYLHSYYNYIDSPYADLLKSGSCRGAAAQYPSAQHHQDWKWL
ncbi:hypothetical protein WJX73_010246 [Symbiochloris irregularis]|uniref:Uncharacterized protein n=1 Tax=Symbiochloris irregularis TaxID=706552 RepID=A0AAW1NWP3_9CHLO